MQGIYRVINKINGKYYVGQSRNVESRLEDHRRELEKRNHTNSILQHAWDKYGKESFTFEFVEEVLGGEQARLGREQECLDKGFQLGVLYNVAKEANCPPSFAGKKRSEEHKAKTSKTLMGHKVSEETLAKMLAANIGRKHSKETKEKMSLNSGIASEYPAFYNVKTEEHIPTGRNFMRLCKKYNFNYSTMSSLKDGYTKQTRDGWRLATKEDVETKLR